MIVNLHRLTTENVGDLKSAPKIYWPFLSSGKSIDFVDWYKSNKDKPIEEDDLIDATGIVVGGGGLLANEFFEKSLMRVFELAEVGVPVVLWGLGHNEWRLEDWRRLKFTLEVPQHKNVMIGVRDYGHQYSWVPCASCMSRTLENPPEPKHEIVTYLHSASKKSFYHHVEPILQFPTSENNSNFDEAIAFLASGETILTDSYHGAYWGTLLGRKVVAFPSSSKFYDLRHAVPLGEPRDWKRLMALARSYPDALKECRAASMTFAKKAKAFIYEKQEAKRAKATSVSAS